MKSAGGPHARSVTMWCKYNGGHQSINLQTNCSSKSGSSPVAGDQLVDLLGFHAVAGLYHNDLVQPCDRVPQPERKYTVEARSDLATVVVLVTRALQLRQTKKH